jgi:3-polyprenyl-4-hydroxybenzoate decarboxylase
MKLVVAITGASGSLYADRLLYYLAEARQHYPLEVGVVLSENALTVWEWELQKPFPETLSGTITKITLHPLHRVRQGIGRW